MLNPLLVKVVLAFTLSLTAGLLGKNPFLHMTLSTYTSLFTLIHATVNPPNLKNSYHGELWK